MYFWTDPQFGDRMITLMAAAVLVLQIMMVAQRWIMTTLEAFAIQSLLLAGIANTIAYFNSAPHLYIAAALTLLLKAILLPVILRRLILRIGIEREIEPFINVPLSVIISGLLTLLAYVVAEAFQPHSANAAEAMGRNTLPVAIALFLIGFFVMINRRKAITQVLGLLSLENGTFLAAISLTYGMPLMVELAIFFDLLAAGMLLAILVYRIRETFDSMDTSRLTRLKG